MSRSRSFKYHRGPLNAVWNYAAGVSGRFSAEVEPERGRGAGGGAAHCGSLRTDPSPTSRLAQPPWPASYRGCCRQTVPRRRNLLRLTRMCWSDIKVKTAISSRLHANVANYGFIFFFTTLKSAYGTSWKCDLSCPQWILLAERKPRFTEHFWKFTFDQTFRSTLLISWIYLNFSFYINKPIISTCSCPHYDSGKWSKACLLPRSASK